MTTEEAVTPGEKEQVEPATEKQPIDRVEVKAYPNPFSTEVNFEVTTPEEMVVSFELYNAIGARVGGISEQVCVKGKTLVVYSGRHLAPGMYLCRVKVGQETKTIHLIIVR